jgi:diguanylate cyclase (GGDEF)-like protein
VISDAIYISELSRSRVTGDWVIYLTIRLPDVAGRFAGVLGISLHGEYFRRLYPELGLGDGDSIVLIRDDGRLLYRYPFDERHTQVALHDIPTYIDLRQGTLCQEISPYDGEVRVAGFKHGDNYPIFAVVSEPYDTALAPWRRNAIEYALLGLIGYAVIVALCVFSLRQLRQLDAVMRISLLDALTGLPNRRFFDQQMEGEWKRIARMRQPYSLLFIDIDHFKRFNDRYGHGAGDECLKRVAKAMEAELRRGGDVLVRFGGEEFVCMLPNTDASGAFRKASEFMQAVNRLDLPHQDAPETGRVTISIGIATATPSHEDNYFDPLRDADHALYQAMSQGETGSPRRNRRPPPDAAQAGQAVAIPPVRLIVRAQSPMISS